MGANRGVTGAESLSSKGLPSVRRRAAVEEARTIWSELGALASARRVACVLRDRGLDASWRSVARWRRTGWQPLRRRALGVDPSHSIASAAARLVDLDDRCPSPREANCSAGLPLDADVDVMRAASRETLLTAIALMRHLSVRAESLIELAPDATISLFSALAASVATAVSTHERVIQAQGATASPPGETCVVATGSPPVRPIESILPSIDPLSAAIEAWKSDEGYRTAPDVAERPNRS